MRLIGFFFFFPFFENGCLMYMRNLKDVGAEYIILYLIKRSFENLYFS